MSQFFREYRDAFNAAVDLARSLGRETGLEKWSEYGKPGYRVFNLPKPENRQGFELRCQVVAPSEPYMSVPVPTVCQETAYGTTERLSFQIKVF